MTEENEDIKKTRKIVGDDVEVVGGGPENGHFTGARPNRAQRRKNLKNKEDILVVSEIIVTFENGQQVNLDPGKVNIVDRETKANLFKQVLEPKE